MRAQKDLLLSSKDVGGILGGIECSLLVLMILLWLPAGLSENLYMTQMVDVCWGDPIKQII